MCRIMRAKNKKERPRLPSGARLLLTHPREKYCLRPKTSSLNGIPSAA